MLSQHEIMQTIQMIDQQHLDVRTITMGISLLSCARSDPKQACGAIYDKITRYAEKLVSTGEAIEKEFGIPIVNKRISVTPIALVAAAAETDNYAPFAAALDRAAKTTGVNFIGGFSALVQKGMTEADRKLIASIPEALSTTDLVCASVNVGSTKAGIDMDAVAGRVEGDALVIGADTVVALDGEILGKPGDEQDAVSMLEALQGRTHQVYTGVALVKKEGDEQRLHVFYERTEVTMYPMSRQEILDYVATGEPMDKAGAYGIQGLGGLLVEGIRGDYYNVMGLPVCRLGGLLRELGVDCLALAGQK